jgi:hypothetical protein
MITVKSKVLILGLVAALWLMPGSMEVKQAEAALGDLLGGLIGGGGGKAQPVRIVQDVSETTILNTLKTVLIEAASALTSLNIESLNLKETTLDPIAWNLAKQLQQQLTGDLLKWLGGQQPGQNGQAPFVQNFAEHYAEVMDGVAGDVIFNDLTGSCSPAQDFQAQRDAYEAYVRNRTGQEAFSCHNPNATAAANESILERMFKNTVNCDGTTACASLKGERIVAERIANAVSNEQNILEITGGMKPQRVCGSVTDPDGGTSTDCRIVNPLFLARDAVSFQLTQVPSLQLLQMDEFNEIVSSFMSNLTNQAVQGLTGVLGLGGNPDFTNKVFGPDGTLSYVDALLQDDIVQYQNPGTNPIKESLAAERRNRTLQTSVRDQVTAVENKNNANKQTYGSCYNLALPSTLAQAKTEAVAAIANSNTAITLLTTLDTQFSSKEAGARNAALSTYMGYRGQGMFRDEHQNRQFELTFVNYTFAVALDRFKYDLATEQKDCGGPFDYNGALAPDDEEEEDEEDEDEDNNNGSND